ncbi:MAG TPA: DUF2357 domain-containing protein [Bacilli bacterium]|nr:DUF2357 domain-containing protein [Bacilli bacterium]
MQESKYVLETTVPFQTREGKQQGRVRILALHEGRRSLLVLSSSEAKQFGEERVQLFEGRTYEYQLLDMPTNWHLRTHNLIKKNLATPMTGRIETGNHTGLLVLELENSDGEPMASASVEVRSRKLNDRKEYRTMLNDIGERCSDLLVDIRVSTQVRFVPDPGRDAETMGQRFAFLRSLLESRNFQDALQRLLSMAHSRLEAEVVTRDIRQGLKPSSRTLREIANGTQRIGLPSHLPLAKRMQARGIERPTVPAQVSRIHHRETVDTPENRFVKYSLTVYVDYLTKFENALSGRWNVSNKKLLQDASRLREQLAEVLSHDFFREMGEPDVLPLGSPVLQRKAGYRELLQAWLRFQLAASLIWHGGEDVYGAGKRDLATLYEYWLFFQFLHILTDKLGLIQVKEADLFEQTPDGLRFKLKAGKKLELLGVYDKGSRPLTVRFSYNRTFSVVNDFDQAGSWTRQMRPDYSLSIWSADLSEAEAEQREDMAHFHFDAKYRAERIEDLIGRTDMDDRELQNERSQQHKGLYKRADLLKMHAYRDAILRTKGAYVLYPGTGAPYMKQEASGSLSGIGAFPVRPDREGQASGMIEVEKFLRSVLARLGSQHE